MNYINRQPVPVYSSDAQPLMATHPARARNLLQKGRAVPHHVKGLFGIRLLDRTREQSSVQDVAINIDPGSQTTGIAVVADNEDGQRTVLAALEIKHRALTIKATLARRRACRRNRRGRLRFRKPRFDNRLRKPGTLPPSVDSLRADTIRVVRILQTMYPITLIRIERNKFDPQLMMNPDIQGIEYQQGTLFGWQVRAYILERDQGRCVYCRRSKVRLELDHVRPRAVGSDRVDNLVACCRDCNIKKDNRPIEQFLTDQPDLLERISKRLKRSALASATHMNAVLPALIEDLRATSLPVYNSPTPPQSHGHASNSTYARHTATTLCCRAEISQTIEQPAQQGGRTQAIQWPFQTEGERRPTRHTRRPALPSTTTPTQPPAKAQPRRRPLRPPPTLRPPEYRHRRHHHP